MRVRVNYSVQGKIRFISHLDLMRAFFRACIRNEIPVKISQGFSPHPKLSFGYPLSVGISGSSEYLDINLIKQVDLEDLKSYLQMGLPDGITILKTKEIPDDMPSIASSINRAIYSVEIPVEKIPEVVNKLRPFTMAFVSDVYFKEGKIYMDVPIGPQKNIRPIEIIKNIFPEVPENELKLWHINRERMYNEKQKYETLN